MRSLGSFALALILVVVAIFPAHAHLPSDEKIIQYDSETTLFELEKLNLNPVEYYLRTQAVLNHFGVPAEQAPDLSELENASTPAQVQSRLRYFDVQKMFTKLFTMDSGSLRAFKDSQSKTVPDFSVRLRSSFNNFVRVHNLPLQGLRIAIDPGHMGGVKWDRLTGKYVTDSNARKVSEGVIALQTSMLLKKDFELLGAQVMLTHSGFRPTTDVIYETFDIRPYALAEFRDSIHAPWFVKLIAKNPVGSALYQSFQNDKNFKLLFSEKSRRDYFIKRADLHARSNLINQFDPHITLIIHYDTVSSGSSRTGLNRQAPNATKVFVHGNYEAAEVGSSTQRALFARGLLNQQMWESSLRLGTRVVQSLSTELGTQVQRQSSGLQVAPGIFARNLVVPRMLNGGAVIYLECLFYNRPAEFEALLITPNPMLIDGKNSPYSNRVAQVAKGIRQGVLNYVAQNNAEAF